MNGKHEYARLRDQENVLGKKTKHLKSCIKRLEEFLKVNQIVYCTWDDNTSLQILLSNGLLIHICIDHLSGDIMRLVFDKFLVGRLIAEPISDVIITRMHIIISYDTNQLTCVYLQKPKLKKSAPKKIRNLDPKIYNYIISGTQTRKIPRHLTCNNSCDLLAVWTKSSQNEIWPWRPTFRDQDRANIHIYSIFQNKLDLLCYYWTENDPINVEFSTTNQSQLRSVEQKISKKVLNFLKYISYNKSQYQYISMNIMYQYISILRIPVYFYSSNLIKFQIRYIISKIVVAEWVTFSYWTKDSTLSCQDCSYGSILFCSYGPSVVDSNLATMLCM